MDLSFRTHTGEIVNAERLEKALNQVADDLSQLAKDIRTENAYASHVTEAQKEEYLLNGLDRAEDVREGNGLNNFTIWQRVNTVLTGECVGLLAK